MQDGGRVGALKHAPHNVQAKTGAAVPAQAGRGEGWQGMHSWKVPASGIRLQQHPPQSNLIHHSTHPATVMSKGKVTAPPETTGGMWSRFSFTEGGGGMRWMLRVGSMHCLSLSASHCAAHC